MVLPCQVFFFADSSDRTAILSGQTRNISNNGLGLSLKRCFHRGEAIEIRIDVPGRPPLHVAGITRFCRYVGEGSFEVGVELMAAEDAPIFAEDPRQAAGCLSWLAEALQRRRGDAYVRKTPTKRDRLMR